MDMVEEQLLAYNAKGLERFIAAYSTDVVIGDCTNNLLMKGMINCKRGFVLRL